MVIFIICRAKISGTFCLNSFTTFAQSSDFSGLLDLNFQELTRKSFRFSRNFEGIVFWIKIKCLDSQNYIENFRVMPNFHKLVFTTDCITWKMKKII